MQAVHSNTEVLLALINIAEKQYHSRKTTNLLAQYL